MKTIKEFDYDLWAIEENGTKKYFIRVKATGEESEVSHEVMKIMLAEEKRMRRDFQKNVDNPTLSLNYIDSICEATEPNWLIDEAQNVQEQVVLDTMENDFLQTLTEKQLELYKCCMCDGMNFKSYAEEKGIDSSTIYEMRNAIRKKYKNFFN